MPISYLKMADRVVCSAGVIKHSASRILIVSSGCETVFKGSFFDPVCCIRKLTRLRFSAAASHFLLIHVKRGPKPFALQRRLRASPFNLTCSNSNPRPGELCLNGILSGVYFPWPFVPVMSAQTRFKEAKTVAVNALS